MPTALRLHSHQLPAGTADALRGLPQLCCLVLSVGRRREGVVASVAQLRLLTELEIASGAALPCLQQLSALADLRGLRLREGIGGHVGLADLLLPSPADFASLKDFDFECLGGRLMQASLRQRRRLNWISAFNAFKRLPSALAAATGLRRLLLNRLPLAQMEGGLLRMPGLQRLELKGGQLTDLPEGLYLQGEWLACRCECLQACTPWACLLPAWQHSVQRLLGTGAPLPLAQARPPAHLPLSPTCLAACRLPPAACRLGASGPRQQPPAQAAARPGGRHWAAPPGARGQRPAGADAG